jgi:hypothetical protein
MESKIRIVLTIVGKSRNHYNCDTIWNFGLANGKRLHQKSTMIRNPILDELRETRERLLAEAGGTLEGLVARMQREEQRSERDFFPPKDRPAARTSGARDASIPVAPRQIRQ